MSQGRGGRFLRTFDVKMLFSSVLFFLEVALKYRPAATETEIKQVMLAQLKYAPGSVWWRLNNSQEND